MSAHPEFVVIIPARRASTRLPDKPLADIAGLPMVVRVAQRAAASGAARVVVAADDAAITTACRAHGIESLLTAPTHPTGTDRLSEAVRTLGLADEAIVVNVQGDEPLIPPPVIAAVAHELHTHADCAIATASHTLTDAAECFSPHVVKVVTDRVGRALYFSRAPIPWSRDDFAQGPEAFGALGGTLPTPSHWQRHIGLYAYRVSFLRRFPKLTRAPIEEQECLEQLRALWHGEHIAVLQLDQPLPPGVDTPEDLQRVRALLANELPR